MNAMCSWSGAGSPGARNLQLATTWTLVALFAAVALRNAWLAEDAYITFRTVDNFVNGYGLRWNAADRVQVFTHPLWLLLVSIPYYLTREIPWTITTLSLLLTVAGVLLLAFRIARSFRGPCWASACLCPARHSWTMPHQALKIR